MSVAAFEVLRFEAVPAAAGVALLELDGRFAGSVPARPRLLVEWQGRARELPAVVDGGLPESWSATFAVPIEALDAEDRGFSLVPGRGPVIALPSPDLASGDDDRFVRLARGANDLRHRLAEASASAATASTRFAELAAERDGLRTDLDALRERAEAAEREAAEAARVAREVRAAGEAADAAAAEARAERDEVDHKLAAETSRADAAIEAARHAEALRDEAVAEAERLRDQLTNATQRADGLQANLVAAEDEVRAARRELRDARARLEALRRERAAEPAEDDFASAADADAESRGDRFSSDEEAPDSGFSGDAAAGETEVTARIAVDADQTEPRPGDDDEAEEPTVVPRPRTPGARRTIRLEPHDDDDVLNPAAVGARSIEPAATTPPLLALTPARIAVGAALLVLFIALVIIFAGGGLV